jgi:hypothetical protein
MMIRVKLLHQMAGDHGCHPPGSVILLSTEVARQVVEGRHGVALDELPEAPTAPEPSATLTPTPRRKRS